MQTLKIEAPTERMEKALGRLSSLYKTIAAFSLAFNAAIASIFGFGAVSIGPAEQHLNLVVAGAILASHFISMLTLKKALNAKRYLTSLEIGENGGKARYAENILGTVRYAEFNFQLSSISYARAKTGAIEFKEQGYALQIPEPDMLQRIQALAEKQPTLNS